MIEDWPDPRDTIAALKTDVAVLQSAVTWLKLLGGAQVTILAAILYAITMRP